MSSPQPFHASTDGTLLFGSCVLDCASARLRRGGRFVPLTPKAYGVLLYLALHAGRLVTKQELFDAAWADVFVGDAALKVCIREIRKALADDAKKPQYIETAHRWGYRFIAAVTVGASQPAGPLPAKVEAVPAWPASPSLESPKTQYARSGDVNIAYQVVGDSPVVASSIKVVMWRALFQALSLWSYPATITSRSSVTTMPS